MDVTGSQQTDLRNRPCFACWNIVLTMYSTGTLSMHGILIVFQYYITKQRNLYVNIYLSGLIERQIAGVLIQMERVALDVDLRSILGRVQI